MADAARSHRRNQLLQRLTERQLGRLAPDLELVEMPRAMRVEAPGKAIAHVYFPASGLGSVVARNGHGKHVEIGLFGRDGMSGLAVVLGSDRSPHQTVVQIPGMGYRMRADALREAMADDPALHGLLLRYVQAAAVQAAHAALANARHGIEERLARWLLMCDDRVDGEVLEVTHEVLSLMLGVRRAGVTMAMHVLEGRDLIRATRGRVRVLDRAGLIEAAGGSYGTPEAEHARLLGGRLEHDAGPRRRWERPDRQPSAAVRSDRHPGAEILRN